MQPLRIALAQIAPRLGDVDANLARHLELVSEAREAGAGLLVFPELGLTGYLLQDLASEVAMRLDDPRLTRLAAATSGLSAVVSFVEESADHRLFIAAALLEGGEIRHVHRKIHLPTYGMFDERRFFAPGDTVRAASSRLGVGIGLAVCEDFWHLSTPQLLALDGAQILVNISCVARPRPGQLERGRAWNGDLLAIADADLRPAHHVVRGVLQSRGCRRVPIVLGRIGGDRADRRPRVQRPDVRGGPVHGGRRPCRRAA